MLSYALRRVLTTVPVLAGIMFVSFFLTHLTGDPSDILLPPGTADEVRAIFRAEHGLDLPLWRQFLQFGLGVLNGDFGRSLRFEQPALELVLERLDATGQLALATLGIALVIGIPSGVAAALRRGRAADVAIRGMALFGQAVPSFYLGVVAIIVFAVWLRWLPTGGRSGLPSLVLPAVTLALGMVSLIARVTRASMLEVLHQDYIRTARAKGLAERLVVWRHALRNAAIPVLTVVGLQTGYLLGGVVVTETVFSWPGVGRLAVQAIYARDFPVVQAVVLLFAVIFVTVNLLVDLAYAALDPRIKAV